MSHRWYYACRGTFTHKRLLQETQGITCPAKRLRHDIEGTVLEYIRYSLEHPSETIQRLRETLEGARSNTSQTQRDLDTSRAQLATHAEARRRARKLYQSERCTEEEYDADIADIEEQETQIKEVIRDYEVMLHQAHHVEAALTEARGHLEQVRARGANIDEWTFEEKQRLVRHWVREIIVEPPTPSEKEPTVHIRFRFMAGGAEVMAGVTKDAPANIAPGRGS